MLRGDPPKWAYTFLLLFMTMGWARFLVKVIQDTLADPNAARIIEVSGVSVLLGALIAWNGTVNSYWFRKAPPKDGISSGG